MIRNITVIVLLLFMSVYAWAGNSGAELINDPTLLYQMPLADDSALNKKVTVNRQFLSFNEFIVMLQKNYGLNAKIVSVPENIVDKVLINITNDSLKNLIEQTSMKFGYRFAYRNNILFFSAISPANLSNKSSNETLRTTVWPLHPSDRTLRNVLTKWCKSAGWQLVWNVRADYPITTDWVISGSFESAINEVLKASQATDTPLLASMHDSNKVLEIYTTSLGK